MVFERMEGTTPMGGDYCEIYYFTRDMIPCPKEEAVRCIVRECKKDGTLLNEKILVRKEEKAP